MTNDRLTHDVAWATAVILADQIKWQREEDRSDAVHAFYLTVREGLLRWQALKDEEHRRLYGAGPSEN